MSSLKKFTLFGILCFALLGIFSTVVLAQDLEFEIAPLYINSGMCGYTEIIIKNIGTEDAFYVDIPDQLYIPNCCSFTSSKTIQVLKAGEQDSIPIRYCAGPSGIKGVHTHDVPVATFDNDYTVRMSIHVTKNYPEVLEESIIRIEANLIRESDRGLAVGQVGPFLGIQQHLFLARDSLGKNYIEETETSIGDAESLMDLLRAEKGGLSFTHVVAPLIVIIVFLLIVFLLYIATQGPEPRKLDQPIPMRKIRRDRESILKGLGILETKLSMIRKEDLRKTDQKYFSNVRKLIGDTKRNIRYNNMQKANIALNEAEMNLSVLEHRIVSLNLMKQVGDLANSF